MLSIREEYFIKITEWRQVAIAQWAMAIRVRVSWPSRTGTVYSSSISCTPRWWRALRLPRQTYLKKYEILKLQESGRVRSRDARVLTTFFVTHSHNRSVLQTYSLLGTTAQGLGVSRSRGARRTFGNSRVGRKVVHAVPRARARNDDSEKRNTINCAKNTRMRTEMIIEKRRMEEDGESKYNWSAATLQCSQHDAGRCAR